MAISDIISVSISIADATPKAPQFNLPLILAKAPYGAGGRLYTTDPAGLSQMVTDGFPLYSRAYMLVSRLAAQSGGVGSAVVYARTTQFTQALEMVPTNFTQGYVYSFNITYHGITSTISHTVGAASNANLVIDAIEILIDASLAGLAGITTTPDNVTATKLTLVPNVAGDFIHIDGHSTFLQFKEVGVDGSIAAQLAVAQADQAFNWYGLLIDSFAEAEIDLAAAFAESNEKIFLGQSADAGILLSGVTIDVASDLFGSAFTRSAVGFTRYMSSDWVAGIMGRELAKTPGSSSWHMKQSAGSTADVLTTTEQNSALAKRAFLYVSDRGQAHTLNGFSASGRFFDITHGTDFLKSDIETAVYQLMLNQEKIPFNATGLAQVEGALRGRLVAAVGAGLIQDGFSITMPSLTGYSTVDKGNRLLRTVRFSATLTGAIHKVTVAGTLTI